MAERNRAVVLHDLDLSQQRLDESLFLGCLLGKSSPIPCIITEFLPVLKPDDPNPDIPMINQIY